MEKTKEEILSEYHGIVPQYLNVYMGKETARRNMEAMQAYADQSTAQLRTQFTRELLDLKSSIIADGFKSDMLLNDIDSALTRLGNPQVLTDQYATIENLASRIVELEGALIEIKDYIYHDPDSKSAKLFNIKIIAREALKGGTKE